LLALALVRPLPLPLPLPLPQCKHTAIFYFTLSRLLPTLRESAADQLR
jgi:hypothetical protein